MFSKAIETQRCLERLNPFLNDEFYTYMQKEFADDNFELEKNGENYPDG